MDRSLTLKGVTLPRILSFISGLGMIVASAMTIEHYFAANFPATIFEGSFCDINAFFNCDSSAFSNISAIFGIPLGFFGIIVGGKLYGVIGMIIGVPIVSVIKITLIEIRTYRRTFRLPESALESDRPH